MASLDAQQQEPLTLPVSDLAASTSFYLASLQPLGYQLISRVRHQTSNGISEAVGLGPQHTTRIDLFLSQINPGQTQRTRIEPAHVVFPALNDIAVREFHKAALKSGGRSVIAPETSRDEPDIFKAKIADLDENTVEVAYCDPEGAQEAAAKGSTVSPATRSRAGTGAGAGTEGSTSNNTIHNWRQQVSASHSEFDDKNSNLRREGGEQQQQQQQTTTRNVESDLPPDSTTHRDSHHSRSRSHSNSHSHAHSHSHSQTHYSQDHPNSAIDPYSDAEKSSASNSQRRINLPPAAATLDSSHHHNITNNLSCSSTVTSSRHQRSHAPNPTTQFDFTPNIPSYTDQSQSLMRTKTTPAYSSTSRSTARSKSRSRSGVSDTNKKTLVGAFLATAAGGILAYRALKSKDDSQDRERSFSARIAARDRVKAEAQEATQAPMTRGREIDMMTPDREPWRAKARSSRRASYAERVDRDSGYHSNAQLRASSPTRVKYRSFQYAEPEPRPRRSRGRSPRASETTTVRAVPIKYTTSSRQRSPNTETPPSIIPPPTTRSRPSSSYRKSRSPPDAKQRSSTSTTKAPPSSYPLKTTTATTQAQPPSRPSSSHSHHSRMSTSGQRTTVDRTAPPTAALTAKALSSHTAASSTVRPPAPSESKGILDELATVVPDDSISCVPSPSSSRRRRKDSSSGSGSRMRGGERHSSKPTSFRSRLLGVAY